MLKKHAGMTRGASLLVLGIVGLVTLVGCTPESAVRARFIDGEVEFMVCRSIQAQRILVAAAGEDEGVDYKDRWRIEGSEMLASEEIVAYGEVRDGWREGLAPLALSPETEAIYVVISGEESTQVAVFRAGMLGEDWSSETGTVDQSRPCGP